MSDALDLLRAILGEHCPDHAALRLLLDTALEREIDPLIHCAITFAIDETLIMERAARWADLAFYPTLPQALVGRVDPVRLETLADVRIFRGRLLDRDIAFAAPGFFDLLRLRQRRFAMPELRQRLCLLPLGALREYLTSAASEALITSARQGLARLWPYASAQLELTKAARFGFVGLLAALLAVVLLAPFLAGAWLFPIALCLLVGPAAIRVVAIVTPLPAHHALSRPPDEELPVYSILIPLRNEADMVPQLFAAMWALDYPSSRLDIKFVVEAGSPDTVAAVRARLGDPRVSLVVVPDTAPRTKPKALGFALPLCAGEFVVIYDAEDIPDPDQLWKAAVRFRDAPDLACLQATLRIDNGDRSWLAALFAAEYAALFTVLLPALACWHMPMPLGGTSNHFRIGTLRDTGGWDAFNVTEDADLGMRLARRRLRVETLASSTREHAPARILPWHGQRTRWMKGWMQTFIVHNRNPARLIAEMGLGPTLAFEVLVLGMIIAPLLHSGLAISALAHLVRGQPPFGGLGWAWLYATITVLGYGSTLAMTTVGLARSGRLDLLPQQGLLPGYWFLMATATIRALRELVLRPFFWFKSPHAPVAAESAGRIPRSAASGGAGSRET